MFNQEQPVEEVCQHQQVSFDLGDGAIFDPVIQRQKWKHKRTSFKIGVKYLLPITF